MRCKIHCPPKKKHSIMAITGFFAVGTMLYIATKVVDTLIEALPFIVGCIGCACLAVVSFTVRELVRSPGLIVSGRLRNAQAVVIERQDIPISNMRIREIAPYKSLPVGVSIANTERMR